MLINLRNALMSGKRTPTARDYVQDGLVAMWDGIENAGWGVHDPNATAWKDLMRPDAASKLSVPSGSTWTDDALNLTTEITTLPPSYFDSISAAGYTFEVVFTIPEIRQAGGEMLTWRNSTKGPLSISTAWQYLRFTGGGNGVYDSDTQSFSIKDRIGESFTAGMSVLVTENKLFVDGSLARSVFPVQYGTSAVHRFYLAPGGQSSVLYRQIRVYSRALTSDEIAANYAIDKARFGLP